MAGEEIAMATARLWMLLLVFALLGGMAAALAG
jgi:hypothetical protein